ncbi:hypothetical protein Trydic_g17864 [Trypoxylus dichotomus]
MQILQLRFKKFVRRTDVTAEFLSMAVEGRFSKMEKFVYKFGVLRDGANVTRLIRLISSGSCPDSRFPHPILGDLIKIQFEYISRDEH